MKKLILVTCCLLNLNLALASPPGSDLPFFVPSGGGYKGSAVLFPLTIEPDACDRGFIVKLLRSPGILGRYRLLIQEVYRGICPDAKLQSEMMYFNHLEISRNADGSVVYESTNDDFTLILSDRRKVAGDTEPKWVALIDQQYYQSSQVFEGDLPARSPK